MKDLEGVRRISFGRTVMTICSAKPLSCKMLSTSVGSIILIPQGAYYFLRYWKVHITSSDSARYILFPQIRGKIGHKHGNSHICAQRKISRGQDPMKICGFPALICPISLAGFQEISRNPLNTPINTSQISKIIVNRSIFPPEHDQDWAKQGKFP